MWQTILAMVATGATLAVAGYMVRALLARLGVPAPVSLLALGLVVGPSVLNWLPDVWLEHRNILSKAAFVVLLLRAGLAVPGQALRPVAVAALVFGTVPVAFEFSAIVGLARGLRLFDHTSLAVLAAFVTAAVSPAVVLPLMLQQQDLGRGAERRVPARIMGQTIVNAFVAQTGILIFLRATAPEAPDGTLIRALLWLPVQTLGGLALGLLATGLLRVERILPPPDGAHVAQRRNGTRAWLATLATFGVGLGVYFGCQRLALESVFATLAVGFGLRRRAGEIEPLLRGQLRQVWRVAEVFLFANLGSQIEIHQLHGTREVALLAAVVAVALAVRMAVAALLTRRTRLTPAERRYTTVAHVPKATIQAVFGALPLATFAERGQLEWLQDAHTILVLAVIAIVGTAPVGALLLDRLGARALAPRDRAS